MRYYCIVFELRYIQSSQSLRLPVTTVKNCSKKENSGKPIFKPLRRKNQKQDEGKSQHDIYRDCEQLHTSPLSNAIEKRKPLMKFNTLKFSNDQVIKNLVTSKIHFKTTMAPVTLTRDKRDSMMCNFFVAVMKHRNGSIIQHLTLSSLLQNLQKHS